MTNELEITIRRYLILRKIKIYQALIPFKQPRRRPLYYC